MGRWKGIEKASTDNWSRCCTVKCLPKGRNYQLSHTRSGRDSIYLRDGRRVCYHCASCKYKYLGCSLSYCFLEHEGSHRLLHCGLSFAAVFSIIQSFQTIPIPSHSNVLLPILSWFTSIVSTFINVRANSQGVFIPR